MVTAAPFTARNLQGLVLSRKWRVIQKLGEGGMGEVYAADPIEVGARVAIKVLRAEFLGEPHVLSRFLDEARTCTRLIHPNIVRMLEWATAEDGSPYLVMELLDGVPLGAYTQNGGRVPVAQAVPILQGILAGLAAAHAQGIVHRDLKPDNVFLTRGTDGTFAVKVLDFGIARVMDEAGGMGSRTRTGMLLGTPAYMSPEQVKDPRDVDQRADLWSAGVMFYEMLTGRVAFPAPTAYARLAAVLSVEPPSVESVDPALLPLSGFVTRSLRKNRAERFGSALEMARALAAAAPNFVGRSDGRATAIALSGMRGVSDAGSLLSPLALHSSPGETSPSLAPTQALGNAPWPAPGLPGATLASAAASPLVTSGEVPRVVGAESSGVGETLPSKGLPVIPRVAVRRGVSPLLLLALLAIALAAGFALGWALRG